MERSKSIVTRAKETVSRMGRYKYVLLVVLVGIVLLVWPEADKREAEYETTAVHEEDFSVDALERKLEATLSQVDGAGSVSVMLTVQSGMKRVFAQDNSLEQSEGELQRENKTVIVSAGSSQQETVLVQQIYPQFQGALVVAEGGADPGVQLKLTEAVAALTGLGADKISICKGK